MPAIDYAQFAQVALNILKQFGTTATLTRKPVGTYDPSTSMASVTPAVSAVTAIAMPYERTFVGQDVRVDGSILQGDLQALVSPQGLASEPRPGDIFNYQGVKYSVIGVKAYGGPGAVAVYEMQVRK